MGNAAAVPANNEIPNAAGDTLIMPGQRLKERGYRFHTPTPETHRRVLARAERRDAKTLADVFGWNKPFAADMLPPDIWELLAASGCVQRNVMHRWKSTVRFSTLGAQLFVHSGFPTSGNDAVFFGPDTYCFARAMEDLPRRYPDFRPRRILDIGAGSGAGGLHCATLYPDADILLSDINPAALAMARMNASINGAHDVSLAQSDLFANIEGKFDLIVANPPYLVDAAERAYRHGGGRWGCALAERIARESLSHLTSNGKLLLYTGTPIVDGEDKFFADIQPLLSGMRGFRYEEIDPDVFGEELVNPPYTKADRIAAVMLLAEAKDLRS